MPYLLLPLLYQRAPKGTHGHGFLGVMQQVSPLPRAVPVPLELAVLSAFIGNAAGTEQGASSFPSRAVPQPATALCHEEESVTAPQLQDQILDSQGIIFERRKENLRFLSIKTTRI